MALLPGPGGIYVELQVDNFAKPEDATAYMEGPEFGADPGGVSFDPEKMIAARSEGVGVHELITRSGAKATSPDVPNVIEVLVRG